MRADDLRGAITRADAPRADRPRRARRLPVGRRPEAVPARGVREGRAVGGRRVHRGGAAGRDGVADPGRQHGGARPCARPRRDADGAPVLPLRRAAAARRGRVDGADLGADRARRPLVRARLGRLQGQHRHAPHGAARARRQRRLPVRHQADLRGLRGAGHRRPGGVRAGERGAPARGHDPRGRHRQLRRRRPDAHEHAAGHDERRRHGARARQRDALGHVRRARSRLAGGADPDARLAARRARQHDGRRARRDRDVERRRVLRRAVPQGRQRARRRRADGRRQPRPTCCGRAPPRR